MTENEFNQLADKVFERIESALDAGEADIEYDRHDSLLEMELANGSKLIVSRHVPNREIWLAAPSGGFHYAFVEGRWFSQRDGSELFAKLRELIQSGCGVSLEI